MNPEAHAVHSFVGSVAIAEAQSNRARWLKRHFQAAEITRLKTKPIQTMAADLALKYALKALFSRLSPARTFTESDFVVGRDPHNAPCIRQFPALRRPSRKALRERLSVSISHTATQSCALAIYSEKLESREHKPYRSSIQ